MTTYNKAVALLSAKERKRGVAVLLLVIGMALFDAIGVASVMPFLAVLGNPDVLDTSPILARIYKQAQGLGILTPDDFMRALGLATFVLIVFSSAYRTLAHFAVTGYIQTLQHTLSLRILESYLHQPYVFFLNRHSGELSKTILSEVGQVVSHVYQPVFDVIAHGMQLIAITVLLVLVDPWLALLAVGLLGGSYVLVFFGLRARLNRLGGDLVRSNEKRFMAASEALGGIKDIKLLGCEKSYLERFDVPSRQFAATQASHQTLAHLPVFLIEAIIFGAMILFTVVLLSNAGGLGSQALGQTLPILGLYAFAAIRIKPAVQNIYSGFVSLRYGKAAIDQIYTDMHLDNFLVELQDETTESLKARSSIKLQSLSFCYPGANRYSLVCLDLEIPVGSTIGIVGSTGAGKTTLVDIILGLLRPSQGAIAVDGMPVADSQLRAWQRSLGYVPQQIFLADTSLAENIAMGVPFERIDNEQVIRCARMAQVHDFIMQELPAQYQTLVGERGVRLSGGQRQRIGIARALYHNPDVLVFDEATSALDTVTEHAVMEAIDALTHQKTIILIAHRLSTVKNCDQIVLLENGQVMAKGTYSELLKNNHQFQSLANHV